MELKPMKLLKLLKQIRSIPQTVTQLTILQIGMMIGLTQHMMNQLIVHNQKSQTSEMMIVTPNHLITTDHNQALSQLLMRMISQIQKERNTTTKMTESSILKSSQLMTKEMASLQPTHGYS